MLDASGSMLDQWERPNQTRWSVAKSILTKLVDSLGRNPKLELALRVYGHRSPQQIKNCQDTWLEVPFKSRSHTLIVQKLNEIKPKGVTPITYSLEQAANDFPSSSGYRNIVILITDGIESCGGDLCAMSLAMQKKGVFLRPYIIGIGLRTEKTLECAGRYIDADTPGKFNDVLNEAIETSFATTTVSVNLLDAFNKPTESNVNVSFRNSLTGAVMYDFVHWRDSQGSPDSVQIDPVVDYDLVVNTIPPIVKSNIGLQIGKHNVLTIPAPQGNIVVKQEGRRDNNLQSLVRLKGRPEVIHTQASNLEVRYLTGAYEVETLTLPRRVFQVNVAANKTQSILLPAPGIVNFNTISSGYGSLYEIAEDGTESWVCNLNDLKSQFPLSLLPGNYKVVFRVRNTSGSKYTAFKKFTVKSGVTMQVSIFN